MRRNGGILDKVEFLLKTNDPADLAYLDKLLARNPEYIKKSLPPGSNNYENHYSNLERETIYFKLGKKTQKIIFQPQF